MLWILAVFVMTLLLLLGPNQFDTVLESWDTHLKRKAEIAGSQEEVELDSTGFGFQLVPDDDEDEEEYEDEGDGDE